MGRARTAAALVALAVTAAACGGGSDGGGEAEATTTAPPTTAPSTTVADAPADPAAAEAEIRATFTMYFDSSTPEAEGLALAQDAEEIGEVLAQASASAPPGARTAEVTGVTFTSATTADVAFTLYIDGNPVLPFQGDAVLEDGVWKVGRDTSCDLVQLQGLTCP